MKTTVPDKIKAHIIMTDTGEKTFFMRWLPVLTLTLCTFVFNTSEFIPIGLLTDIGRDFGRTEAEMGWLVTTYAWVVALMSLPLMLLASKMECRRLMMSVLALFVASHVLSAVASNYWILLASRLGVACSHAIFWSVVSPLAVEVAPKHKTSAALGLVVAGSSIAMIAGLPLGRVLGLYLGWRMTFLAIGLVAAIALVCLWRFFPSVHSRNAVALDKVPALLSRPMRWLPVLTLTLCTFVFNTSEFIPIGLLTDIGRDFGRTEAEMGWLVTTYAWVVALMSLPLMLLASKMECRRLMMSVLALFVASHVLSAVASNYWILLASRLGVACSHAIFWSVVSPLAVEVAPKHKTSAALGLVVAGSSIAMIAGLPLGRVLGLYLGWRMTFLAIGLVAAIALVCLWRFFPSVHSRNAVALDKVPALLSRPALMGIYILTPLIMTGNFTVYSYIEPFLAQVTGMLPDRITWVLVAYGAVGILGSWIFSHFFDRRPIGFLQFSVFGIVASLFLMAPLGGGELTIVLLCIFWGLAVTLYNLVFQSAIIRAVPSGTAVAMSVYSGIYNVGIGSGALVGGLVCTHASIADIGWAGGAIAAAGALFCLLRVGPVMRGVFAKS